MYLSQNPQLKESLYIGHTTVDMNLCINIYLVGIISIEPSDHFGNMHAA